MLQEHQTYVNVTRTFPPSRCSSIRHLYS